MSSSPSSPTAPLPRAPLTATALTALILAGGQGSRLRSVVGALPKVLAPVASSPFLDYLLTYLRGQGIADVLLATGYGATQVAAYGQDGARWGITLRYSEERELLGTGGAIKQAEALLASNPFLVLNGDSLVHADLARLLAFHAQKRARISLVLVEVPDTARFGSVVLDADGAIVAFREKGHQGPGLINAGIYAIDRTVLAAIPTGGPVSVEREIFPAYAGAGLYGLVVPGPFIDIGTPDAYALAQTVLAGGPVERQS